MPELPERSADVAGRSGSRRAGPIVAFLVVAIAALIVLAFATGDRGGARDPSAAATAPAASTLREGETAARIERNARKPTCCSMTRCSGDSRACAESRWSSISGPPGVHRAGRVSILRGAGRAYDGRVAFLGLNSRDGRAPAEDFLDEHAVNYPSVFDESGGQARSIGAGASWPTTVFFDAGRQRRVHPAGRLRGRGGPRGGHPSARAWNG